MDDTIYIPADLTPEERIELENIRRRKQELLEEIQRLRDELSEAMNEVEGLEANEGSKTLQRNRKIGMGRKKFNMDPKKGIVFLQENELLRNTAEDIARFLYKGEGLNKTAIGDYLGEREDFNISVLHAFVDLHEFTDLNLVQALRQFLWSFRLPGEAQKIDRMMEAFAQRYCMCNPGVFQSTGGRVKTWKRRWFILTDNCLYYFEYTTDKEPRGIIPLENLSIREVEDPRKPNCFELYIPNNKGQLIKACKTEADGRVVEGNHNVYRISAPTPEEKEEWIKSIQAAVSVDPFYEMLAARKKRISVKKKQQMQQEQQEQS
ncbi:hypothetical protein GDO78_010710 [Eleutherodactylus coqui]|uniref:Cytohesin-2 n=1 Tax=Eleutherodactylus coqui TaxID=57060 RepID=A0A8J6F410_ELECQ|nr:hypothetical protein GDO78_010710 [Eleutherodactylus coqui]